MTDYQPSNFVFVGNAEDPDAWDTPGGEVQGFKAAAALNIGDAVFHTAAAFTVDKSATAADYQKFAGIVVGGAKTFGRALQDDEDVGEAAAATGELVLVCKNGKVKVLGFDFNRFALRNVQGGYWDADVQCSPRQAAEISSWIKAKATGKALPSGIIYQKEISVDSATITDDIITNKGINADPGKGVITK